LEKGETGIVIADEGISSLDEENLTHVLTIFQNMSFQLFFIVHNLEEVSQNIKTIDLNKER
jgi:ABC-type dipeptide/oligopeptide/nickel transport system ATPase subunit